MHGDAASKRKVVVAEHRAVLVLAVLAKAFELALQLLVH